MATDGNIWLGASTRQVILVLAALVIGLAAVRRLWVDRIPYRESLFRLLGRVEMAGLAALIGAMIMLSALQIVLRNVAGSGLLWIDPLLRYLTLWIGLLGAAYATAAGRHIQIDVLARLSPPAVQAVASRVVSGVAACVTMVLAEAAYRYVVDEYRFATTAFLGIPTWMLLVVLPLAFALMSYRFLYRAVAPTKPTPAAAAGEQPT